MDWSIIVGIGGIAAIIGVIIEACYRIPKILRERKFHKISERKEIYEPLLREVESLENSIKNFSENSDKVSIGQSRTSFLRTIKGKIPTNLYKKIEFLFEKQYGEFHDWLIHNEEFIKFKIQVDIDERFSELRDEFKALGIGVLEDKIYNEICLPIMKEENISLRWLEDHNREFYNKLKKCSHFDEVEALFNWLKKPDPAIKFLKEKQSILLSLVQEIEREIKKI